MAVHIDRLGTDVSEEAAGSVTVLVTILQTTKHHIAEDSNLNTHCHEITSNLLQSG